MSTTLLEFDHACLRMHSSLALRHEQMPTWFTYSLLEFGKGIGSGGQMETAPKLSRKNFKGVFGTFWCSVM